MKKYEYIVCGGAGVNKFVFVNNTPQVGRTSHATNENYDELFLGGTGLNIAYCMMKMGIKVLPVLTHSSGETLDTEIKKLLTDISAPIYALEPPVKGASGYGMLIKDSMGNHLTVVCHKNNAAPPYRNMDDSWFADSEMGVLSIAVPHNVVQFLEKCKKNNVPLAFSMRADPFTFPDPVLDEILRYSKIIFTNCAEREYIEQTFHYEKITDLFYSGNAEIIVTTLGAEGCVVYSKQPDGVQAIKVPVTEGLPVVDETGAGDSFVAGFLFGYKRGLPLEVCAQYGSTLASFVIEQIGCLTNVPTLEKMLERNSLRNDAKQRR